MSEPTLRAVRRLPIFRTPTFGFCRELGRFVDLSGLEERIMQRIREEREAHS